jgi:Putative homoserine kinase type II (protein kinase fold)
MTNLFTHTIDGKASWAALFRSTEAFSPLADHILARHGLPRAALELLAPGTNAVFGAGGYVIKIFAPDESGFGIARDYFTELYGLLRAERLGVPVPSPTATGQVDDRYLFRYIVMRRAVGTPVCELLGGMSDAQKYELGKQMRDIVDRLDTPDDMPGGMDDIPDAFKLGSPDFEPPEFALMNAYFRRERAKFLQECSLKLKVYVHGDLTGENVLLGADGEPNVIDFADACVAPPEYELAPLVCELFRFEPACLRGCFGDFYTDELAARLTPGLLMHRFGYGLIRERVCDPAALDCIDDLRRAVRLKLEGNNL